MKVKFSEVDNKLEIYYYEDESEKYRSWKMPLKIVREFVKWRPTIDATKDTLPIKAKKKDCEFEIVHDKWVYIKEVDENGYRETVGWDLPKVVQNAIIEYYSLIKEVTNGKS